MPAAQLTVQVIAAMGALLDLHPCEGVFLPGGSHGNLVGLLLARDRAFPHVRIEGWRAGDAPTVLVSDQAHYSMQKAAMILGCGLSAITPVQVPPCGA